jgi:hypothetical protein
MAQTMTVATAEAGRGVIMGSVKGGTTRLNPAVA